MILSATEKSVRKRTNHVLAQPLGDGHHAWSKLSAGCDLEIFEEPTGVVSSREGKGSSTSWGLKSSNSLAKSRG
jgi:hypothetical protein